MSNHAQRLALPPLRIQSRTEFTALRARVKGLPIVMIARLYFDIHSMETLEVEFDVSGEQETMAPDAFVRLFAYATGLRRAELAAATTGALTRTALDGALDDAWSLRVMGKGRRARTVPMPRRWSRRCGSSCAAHRCRSRLRRRRPTRR
ncbi:hypothetical protein [Burkholderia stabilis]|uniref:hypothetical protein n=1 Tax=Burkholderia stabilis TaxID=95485 RepID=UPI0023EA6FF8|nr:hypothetical protein [Burkholderia stabilis]